ncbi:MAG: mechanosensitive ion channel family protein [Halobacteria archaeon]|nr:mechanosensitive ion channel family protein [Halobacteria archaeon]
MVALPEVNVGVVLSATATFVFAYLIVRVGTYLLTRVSERSVERRITVKMLIPVFKLAVYAGAVYYVLGPLLRLTSTQLLAFSGFLGAALGFGLKDLLANLVGGFVVVAERPYRIGDKIRVGEHYGEVSDIGLRSTKLVTPDDSLVSVPNYLTFTESVSNSNSGKAEMMAVVELSVSPDADVEGATSIVREALLTSRYVYVSDDCPVTVLVDDRPYRRVIKGKAYVNDVRNEFEFKSDVTERAVKKFSEEGIEKPGAHVDWVSETDTGKENT